MSAVRSEAQIAASRANGAKSKGPITPEGKRICAMNAVKHGGAAQCVVLACEDIESFNELIRDFTLEYRPKTRTETELVETLAEARWSYQRMVAMRKLALDRDVEIIPQSLGTPPERLMLALTEPGNHTSGPARHDRLLRYQMSHDRHFHRTLKQLLALQDRNARDPELAGSDEPYVPTTPSLPTFLPEPADQVPAREPEQNSTEQTQAPSRGETGEWPQVVDDERGPRSTPRREPPRESAREATLPQVAGLTSADRAEQCRGDFVPARAEASMLAGSSSEDGAAVGVAAGLER